MAIIKGLPSYCIFSTIYIVVLQINANVYYHKKRFKKEDYTLRTRFSTMAITDPNHKVLIHFTILLGYFSEFSIQ